MKSVTKNNKGITLIELIVVMAIMSLIFGAVFSVYLAGQRTFTKTRNQVDVQQNLRRVTNEIVKELAFARDWELLENIPTSFNPSYNYIYVENQILYIRRSGDLEVFDEIEYTISLTKTLDSLLGLRLEGRLNDHYFFIETEIRKLNEGVFTDRGSTSDRILIKYLTVYP